MNKKNNMPMWLWGITTVILVVGLILIFSNVKTNTNVVDNTIPTTTQDTTSGEFKAFNNSDFVIVTKGDLLNILKQNTSSSNGGRMYKSSALGMETMSADVAVANAPSADATTSGTGSSDYSETNVQVKGIDEGDIVKTNGKKIFIANQNKLTIVNNTTPPLEDITDLEVSKLKSTNDYYYPDETIRTMLVDNDLLYVVTVKYNQITKFDESLLYPQRIQLPITVVTTYDTTNDLEKLNQVEIDGDYYESRSKDGIVYIITSNYQMAYSNPMAIKDLLIRPITETKNGQTTTFEKQMIMPRDSTPENKTQYTFTTIKYDSSKDSVIDSLDILLDYSNTIYMSNNNLYITSKKQTYFTPWFFYRGGNNSNLDVFKEIYKDIYPSSVQRDIESNIDDAEKLAVILNDYYNSLDEDDKEKLYNKIQEETDNYYANIRQENEKTIINRIELNSNGKFGDITTGEVQGNLLNQFSMDEDADGYLRLAVTKTDKEYKNVNAIVILDIQLQEYSKLDDLAKDERIYSVRFMGDKVFLVTFKQIDPFFVIDLSDKRNPEVLGYLKIPGYSSYLHPISDTLILGIGQDTKVSQWGGTVNSGVKVTLFDVSDYSDPEEVATYKITSENSYTPVQNDHKAFMYMESEKLIVLPVTENFNTRGPETNFYVLKVTDSDIVKTEIISHSGQSYGNILRSLYIGKEIYTISDNQIKTYNVDTEEMVSKGI